MALKVIIIGAVAAGPKAGCRLKRLDPSAEVIMVDRDPLISYGGCGIPYFVSGDVSNIESLRETSFHMLRDEAFFKQAKGVEVMAGWEAIDLDRAAKKVVLRRVTDGEEQTLEYDKLVLATGSRPRIPPIPGADLPGVHPVADLHQAEAIQQAVARGLVGSAVVVGAGATGLEMAEALADLWGLEVTVAEMAPQILPGVLDPDMAAFLTNHLRDNGISVELEASVDRIIGQAGAEGEEPPLTAVTGAVINGREVEAELVVLACGVIPAVELARAAGLEVGRSGALKVDRRLRTSDPDIYAGGDCVANTNLISGRETYLAAGSVANRHGRVIGSNLTGMEAEFSGVVGNWIMKSFDLAAAKVGLTTAQALEAGFDALGVMVVQADRAHFYPDQQLMYLKIIVDRSSRRVLGLQGLAKAGDGLMARMDALAALLPHHPTVEDLSNLEMAYAPPFSAAMDILNAAGNVAENMLDGRLSSVDPVAFGRLLDDPPAGAAFLDVRKAAQADDYVAKWGDKGWLNIPQELLPDRLAEVPNSGPIYLVCNSGARSYEAQITLRAAGIKDIHNLAGGIAAARLTGKKYLDD